MKTFEVWENIDYDGNNSDKIHWGYIKAKNLQNATKRALREYLTKEQRKNLIVSTSDSDITSYDFDSKWYNDKGEDITDQFDEFNEDTMSYSNHEIVIEELENGEGSD